MKSAAENIYPAEVEGALNAHPAVKESAIIGVPDPTWGQSVLAVVVLADDADRPPRPSSSSTCASRIASYKKPKQVVFRDEPLPRNGWPIDYDALDAAVRRRRLPRRRLTRWSRGSAAGAASSA